jgi:hypothetical protein
MATGRISVAPGETIQSAEWGNPLWDHSVMCFATTADRTAQFPSPQEGSLTWIEDVNRLQVRRAGAWVNVALDINESGWVSTAAVAGFTGDTIYAMHAGTVTWSCRYQKTATTASNVDVAIQTLPSWARPSASIYFAGVWFLASTYGTESVRFRIDTDGQVNLQAFSIAGLSVLAGSVTYPVVFSS